MMTGVDLDRPEIIRRQGGANGAAHVTPSLEINGPLAPMSDVDLVESMHPILPVHV